ncbi:protein of unknown function [Candidatus Filomicrobium marinum]|uniref:Uncharacterized protein n=1 Tax=Candidatus Filomicrobium marinum TaxID=1608628 RepID=A0A0D6JHJ8_9HYPH|nr:protein of unknown function [Candidatus Filomicrobium marinum]CPR21088.1 protein of unknown function [Candidatus Filomicrobium marinum]
MAIALVAPTSTRYMLKYIPDDFPAFQILARTKAGVFLMLHTSYSTPFVEIDDVGRSNMIFFHFPWCVTGNLPAWRDVSPQNPRVLDGEYSLPLNTYLLCTLFIKKLAP